LRYIHENNDFVNCSKLRPPTCALTDFQWSHLEVLASEFRGNLVFSVGIGSKMMSNSSFLCR